MKNKIAKIYFFSNEFTHHLVSDGKFDYDLGENGIAILEECDGIEPYTKWNTFAIFHDREELDNTPSSIRLDLLQKPSPDFESETLDSTSIILTRR